MTPTARDPLADAPHRRRHPEWAEFATRWRWLQDSLEGGERYRNAVYGMDRRGLPVRNLIRHKREYPDPRDVGTAAPPMNLMPEAPGTYASDDDYELRRARTPVPAFTAEAITRHLERVFAREVERDGPDELKAWWGDVDGMGTPVDAWMSETVAPLLLSCGNLDVLFDRPAAPEGAEVATEADVRRLGLNRCVASHVLPENVVWWRLGPDGRYAEALVLERDPEAPDGERLRHWTADGWTLFAKGGKVESAGAHRHGVVPLVRAFTGRKGRCRNVGVPHYEVVAELQREFYNRDSELILSDTTQAHPLLQGPEDFVQADGTIPIGPSWLLPKKKNSTGGSATYEGFDVVEFPKGGAESIRLNKGDLREAVDRATAQVKPAGATGGTVSQSGVSKQIDQQALHGRLAKVAGWLRQAELLFARMALQVLHAGDAAKVETAMAAVKVVYPTQFELQSVQELADAQAAIRDGLADAADLPRVTEAFLCKLARVALAGHSDDEYEGWEEEIRAAVEARAAARRESDPMRAGPAEAPPTSAAMPEPDIEDDPPTPPGAPTAPDGEDPEDL